jgi:hypothetical protein
VGNLEGKRTVVRPRLGWVDNIKIDFGEIWSICIDWIDLIRKVIRRT